jgi:hypothetical protein
MNNRLDGPQDDGIAVCVLIVFVVAVLVCMVCS